MLQNSFKMHKYGSLEVDRAESLRFVLHFHTCNICILNLTSESFSSASNIIKMPFPLKKASFSLWHSYCSHMQYLHRTGKPCMFRLLIKHFRDTQSNIFRLSSIQQNIVLPYKRRIPERKLLALFKPLRNTFLHENSNFVIFQSSLKATTLLSLVAILA